MKTPTPMRRPLHELKALVDRKVGDFESVEMQGRFDFLWQAHDFANPGDLVVDVGAGRSWYHPFFEHTRYLAIDRRMYSEKLKEGTDILDVEGDALNVPLKTGVADMMLSVSMLEHMSEPLEYLREAYRILKPGGRLCLFVPFITGVHMAPYDFFRYTRHGLEHLFAKAGFVDHDIRPSCGAFATVLGNTKKLIPHFKNKGWLVRKIGSLMIWRVLIPLSNRIDHWDTKRDFPRFYLAFARKPQ